MTLVVQVLVGVVFATAAATKARHPATTRTFVRSVVRLGGRGLTLVTAGLVVAETVVAVLLLVPLAVTTGPGWVSAGFGLALALLIAFSALLGLAIRRGVRTACGCFGSSASPPSLRHLTRNGFLAGSALLGLTLPVEETPQWTTAAGAIVGLLAAVVVITLDDLVALFATPKPTRTRPGGNR